MKIKGIIKGGTEVETHQAIGPNSSPTIWIKGDVKDLYDSVEELYTDLCGVFGRGVNAASAALREFGLPHNEIDSRIWYCGYHKFI